MNNQQQSGGVCSTPMSMSLHSSSQHNCDKNLGPNNNGNSGVCSQNSSIGGGTCGLGSTGCNNINNNSACGGGHSGPNSNCGILPKNRICRDFVRGLCRRKQCRYPHVLSPDLVVFCHDFQNSNCPRKSCKFLHYSLQEEEFYRKFGEFPMDHMADNSTPQTCKDILMYGSCRHRDCYINSGRMESSLPPPQVQPAPPTMWTDHTNYMSNTTMSSQMGDYRSPCDEFQGIKRVSRVVMDGPEFKRFRDDSERDVLAIIRHFEEEQLMLRRRVEANEIKIAELRASNEYLIAQNAQLRMNNVQQCSSVVNPVTVTQTTSQPQTPQVMGGVSIAPVQVQATPIVSIATPQTQIIANSAPPLAIAANTSQAQQLAIAQQNITSLSSTSQPMTATHAQQILGTSQITLAPAIAQGPSMGLTINTSQALAMSNATQPIISYPVMTHSILPH